MKRHFIDLDGRRLHFLTAGRGFPLLLLHGSPNRSDSLAAHIRRWSRRWWVIAPDTPGNGSSEPLSAERPGAGDYARVMDRLCAHLGLTEVLCYGFHTGAVFAAELAATHPRRCRALLLDGYPLWTEQEAKEKEDRYFHIEPPRADGAHLASLWSRVLDQTLYFPWHCRDEEHCYLGPPVDPARLHQRCLEFMDSGPNLIDPYRPAMQADGLPRLRRVACPTWLTSVPLDPLYSHLERAGSPPEGWRIQGCDGLEQLLQEAEEWFAGHTPGQSPPPAAWEESACHRFLEVDGGQLYLHCHGKVNGGDGRGGAGATLHLHGAGRSQRQLRLADRSGGAGPAGWHGLLDLPGHGLSTAPFPEEPAGLIELLRTLPDRLAALGLPRPLQWQGHHDPLARWLAASLSGDNEGLVRPAQLQSLALELMRKSPETMPQLEPHWSGCHLLAAWHFNRFGRLFQPWHRGEADFRRRSGLPGAETLHEETADLLRAGMETLGRALPLALALEAAEAS